MSQINENAAENLRALHEESGQSWESLASGMDTYDPAVAAWMRGQADAETPTKSAAPKGRRSKADADSVEG